MSTILGLLGLSDVDTTVNSVGQSVVFDAINQLAAAQQAEVQQMLSVFVQTPDTTMYQERYFLPGGGKMQPAREQTVPNLVKPVGSYTTAYPIRDFRDAMGWTDVSRAYMKVGQLDAQLQTLFTRYNNTARFEVLKALLNNVNETFVDDLYGSLTLKRLANADTDTYPPVQGSESEATEDHYPESGYAASAISDTNNPYATIRDEIEEHFGEGNIVAFINTAQIAKTAALTDFVDVDLRDVRAGASTATIVGSPGNVPGRVLGKISNVWVVEWRWVPANYILAVDLDQPAPLKRRVDEPAELRGFGLVARDERFPLELSYWRVREGYAVANRLNGVALELGTGGTYTIPTAYA